MFLAIGEFCYIQAQPRKKLIVIQTLISFLYSSGAIKASKKIEAPDWKVGLSNLLITIEMAIFSILHLWAFAWQEYSVKRVQDVEAFYGDGKPTYQGGFCGLKALLDALNPLDLLKAISRGFRWLFVGRKKRMLDPSYQVPSEQIGLDGAGHAPGTTTTNTAYEGAGALMAGGRTSPDQEGDVLLSHAQPNPTAHGHSDSETGLVIPPAYDDEHHDPFYTSNNGRLSNSSLLDPMAPSPQPYSPYDDSFHNPYMVPVDHGGHEDLHHNAYSTHHLDQQETGVTTGPYPSHDLHEHEPIPMPESYQSPPHHDDYDHHERRY